MRLIEIATSKINMETCSLKQAITSDRIDNILIKLLVEFDKIKDDTANKPREIGSV